MFAPRTVEIRNPRRFSLLYAPITRSYCSSILPDSQFPEPPEYRRNQWNAPKSAEENLAFLKDWQKTWTGPAFSYEYHFWQHQCYDPSGLYIARRIYEDIRSLRTVGLDGYVEDGSQRSFWPNGFAMYVYAETLMNRDCDFDEVARDYFSHIYGEAWEQALECLTTLRDTLDYPWMAGEAGPALEIPRIRKAMEALAAREAALAKSHRVMPYRAQTISMRLLSRHAEYIRDLGEVVVEKALGNHQKAAELLDAFRVRFGAYEVELERYFDHFLAFRFFQRRIGTIPKTAQETE
jgi:hypothetical protein